MSTLWIGFVLGCIFFPVMYAIIPSLFGIKKVRSTRPTPVRNPLPVSETLKTEISNGLTATDNLAWINIIIQRMYFDMIKNYHFEYKMRQLVMRTFASVVGDGMLKNIKITDMAFGFEAPYLRSIRLITPEEYRSLLGGGDLATHTESVADVKRKAGTTNIYSNKTINFSTLNDASISTDLSDLKTPILNARPAAGDDVMAGDMRSGGDVRSDGMTSADDVDLANDVTSNDNLASANSIKSNTREIHFECTNPREAYENATFIGNMEYNGAAQMMVEVELQMGIHVNSVVTVKKLISDFLFRIPAVGHNTRYEISLINSPVFEIDVSSGLVTYEKRLYFQNSISNFLKRVAIGSIKGMMFYPAWLQGVLPFVASGRLLEFIPRPVTCENLESARPDFEKILLTISTDFRILSNKNGITHGKTYSMLNGVAYVESWTFRLPMSAAVGQQPHTMYDGLNIYESKILSSFEQLEMLRPIVPGMGDVTVLHKSKGIALLKVVMKEYEMELVRLIYKHNLMFFRNNSKYPEFLVLKIQDSGLTLYSFSTRTSDLFLTTKRVARLKMALGASPKLPTASADENSDTDSSIVDVESLFKNAISADTSSFNLFEVTLQVSRRALHLFLLDDALRMKNIHESARIVSAHNQSEKIKAIIIEHPSTTGSGIREFTKVYSFIESKYVVDLCPDRNMILIYRLIDNGQSKDGTSDQKEVELENEPDSETDVESSTDAEQGSSGAKLRILHKSDTYVLFPNFFIELLKAKACFQRYFDMAEKRAYEQYRRELRLENYVKKGSVMFMFNTEFEDDFSLMIYSCRKQRVVFEIYKVISSKGFVVIYPVENDYIRLTLVPKHAKNMFIDYKFVNLEDMSDVYLNCRIGLNSRHKLKIKMEGRPTHVIFWEKCFDVPLKSYIQDSESKTMIGECGVLRSEAREYILVFKNEGEKRRDIDITAGLAGFY